MMSEKMGPIISTNGLVFCVDAANPQSIVSGQTIWKDLTFNTTGGTLVNGVGFSGSGINSALSFDGTDDFVRISSDQPFTPRNGFSVTSWVNPTDITFQRYTEITRRQGSGGSTPTYLLSFQEYGDIISFGLKTTSTYNELDIQINSGGTNTWTSYIGTWDGTNKRLYRNGSNIGQNAQIGTISDDSGVFTSIGSLPSGAEYFRGRISQVQMYDRGLSPFEVYQNYNAIKGRYGIPDIVTGGLVLNLDAGNPYSYNPDNTGSTVWTDVSYTSTGGTLVNGTYYTGGTMTFDGVDDLVTGTFSYTFNTGWSVEIWVYVDSRVSYPDDEGIWRVSLNNNNRLNLIRANTVTNSWRYEVTGPNGTTGSGGMLFNATTDGVWSQIICTYDGNNSLRVYHNNTLVKTGTFNIGNVPVSTYNIGVNLVGPYLQGDVAAFRVYNRELSATEVQQNFNALRGRYGI